MIRDSFIFKMITSYSWGIDTQELGQLSLMLALTYSSTLPWWKWVLFVLSQVGFSASYTKKITKTKGGEEE